MVNYRVDLNGKGEIHLPPEVAERYGYRPGASVTVSETPEGILIHRAQEGLRKIYLEPTNLCNLNCRICIRRSWADQQGMMEMATYGALMKQLPHLPTLEVLQFGGFGEPLLHPEIERMLRMAKEGGRKTELITNGLLLDEAMAERLVNSRLDTVIFSMEGLSAETFEAVRVGASFETFRENIRTLAKVKSAKSRARPRVGMEFVILRRNVQDLEKLLSFSSEMEASFVIINNLLPHTEEMKDQALYNNWTVISPPPSSFSSRRKVRSQTFQDYAQIRLPKIQLSEENYRPLFKLLRFRSHEAPLFDSQGPREIYCRFVNEGYLAIGWDGEVSPCLALMHSYGCYILDRYKQIRRYRLGNVGEKSLKEIWEGEEYSGFRSRVRAFEFSPCAECGGCGLSETNEEDCFGNPFPVCGDCLWARGILQCP
ncbi:MAG: radical SAM protein [candidate division NC10 bacterium]|nr:radical SAM protein [candidate division NC10 bacterium]